MTDLVARPNAELTVSVSMNVPETRPTASVTASAVPISRAVWLNALLTSRRTSAPCRSRTCFMCPMVHSPFGSSISSTTRPSARNTTRSA